jgi:beta-carotene 3-hydroxylase
METLAAVAIFVLTFVAMEAVAYLMHRYLMHGPLWLLHASHHAPRRGVFEWNDLFGVLFALPSMALIDLGTRGHPFALAAGLGMTAYGAAYFGFHDVIVHRRIRTRHVPSHPYLRRIVRAHLVHHRTLTRDGAVSFGFLYAREPAAAAPEPRVA